MLQNKIDSLEAEVKKFLPDSIEDLKKDRGELTIVIEPRNIIQTMTILKETEELSFKQLIDIATIDYLQYGVSDWKTNDASGKGFSRAKINKSLPTEQVHRFAVSYHLLSLKNNWRIRIKTFVPANMKLDSVIEIWPSADWFERESFDLFGVLFVGHPDLRRLLTDYGFSGHPFRKDFPLEGYTEVRYDPDEKRVVNEPVSIEPRTLVPKVIRDSENTES